MKKIRKKLVTTGKPSSPNGGAQFFGGFITEEIHPFVTQSIEYMSEEDNITQEGLFRVSGDVTHINHIKQMLNNGNHSIPMEEIAKNNVHNVTSLFKMYFREMAEPLLTFDHYDMFIAAHGVPDRESRIAVIKKVLRFLPRRNMQLLKTLCKFLHRVMQHAKVNKMTSANLAIVFAPNLLRPKGDDQLVTMMSDSPHTNGLMKTLIEEYELIFEGGDDMEEEQLVPAKGWTGGGSSSSSGSHGNGGHHHDNDEEEEHSTTTTTPLPPASASSAAMKRTLPSTPPPLSVRPPPKPTSTSSSPTTTAATAATTTATTSGSNGNGNGNGGAVSRLPLPTTPTSPYSVSSPTSSSSSSPDNHGGPTSSSGGAKPMPPPRRPTVFTHGVNSVLPPPSRPLPPFLLQQQQQQQTSKPPTPQRESRVVPPPVRTTMQSLPTSPVVEKRELPKPPPQSPRMSLPVPRSSSSSYLVEADQNLSHFHNDVHNSSPVSLSSVETNQSKPLPPPKKPVRSGVV